VDVARGGAVAGQRATGGDVRRICDLFGLSVGAAVRYTAILDHPGLHDVATK